jgi:hypothetical protein
VLWFTLAALLVAAPACGLKDRPQVLLPTSVPPTTVVSAQDLSCAGPAIVRPNCGKKPEQAGDRGGALQITVWVLLVAGLAVVFSVVFRSARRTERAKAEVVGDRNWT